MPVSDPKIDRRLGKRPPRVELALRYSIRGQFPEAKASPRFSARVDELLGEPTTPQSAQRK